MDKLAQRRSLRKSAMMWWISIGGQQKFTFTRVHYPGRRYYSLTGREIEYIYTTDPKSTWEEDMIYNTLSKAKAAKLKSA